jgi:hypothetical protein
MGSLTKGYIGKEDLAIQENENATETFTRAASTGGTATLTKIPDIWGGKGSPNVASIILSNAAGTVTKRVRLNDTGDDFVFTDP